MPANRIFIGIPVPIEIAEQLQRLLPGGDRLKRTAPENYHITLQFLGEVPDLQNIIGKFENFDFESFKISIDGLSGFYKKGRLAVVFLSISEGTKQLTELSRRFKGVFADYDKEPGVVYTPHITINRNIKMAELEATEQLLTFKFSEPVSFEALQIYLYDSSQLNFTGLYRCVSSI